MASIRRGKVFWNFWYLDLDLALNNRKIWITKNIFSATSKKWKFFLTFNVRSKMIQRKHFAPKINSFVRWENKRTTKKCEKSGWNFQNKIFLLNSTKKRKLSKAHGTFFRPFFILENRKTGFLAPARRGFYPSDKKLLKIKRRGKFAFLVGLFVLSSFVLKEILFCFLLFL